MSRYISWTAIVAAIVFAPAAARAEVFKLRSGGEVRGELANPDETPREKYIVRPFIGGELTLQAAVVAEVIRQRPNEIEYEKAKVKMADTVDGHWKMAQWCSENKMETARNTHLRRVIELEPDHAEARRLLRYVRVGQRWLTIEEKMKEDGKVRLGDKWVPVQEVERLKQLKAEDDAQNAWFKKLSQYRSWMSGDKAGAAKRAILEINDKAAEKPLITKLKNEKDYRVRELYIQAMANLGTPDAVKTIVENSINDSNDRFRDTCLEVIKKHKPAGALPNYLKGLGDKSNTVVNRSARGLERLGDQAAVRPLIDALVTKHKFIINTGGGAGSISPTFSRDANGNGGSGLSTGGGPKVVYRNLNNDAVLAALVELTGQDFDYNVESWKDWYAANKQEKQPPVNPRRD